MGNAFSHPLGDIREQLKMKQAIKDSDKPLSFNIKMKFLHKYINSEDRALELEFRE